MQEIAIVRKFFVFFFLYLLYMLAVFVAMALLWKFSYEWGWTKYAATGVLELLLLMVLVGAPPALFNLYYSKPSGAQKKLLQSGQEAPAQILQVADTGLSLGDSDLSFVVRLTLWVKPLNGEPFQAQVETSVSRAAVPREGDRVRVKFDAQHRDKVVLLEA